MMYARYQATLAELIAAVLAGNQPRSLMLQAVDLVAQTLAVAYSAVWELFPAQGFMKLCAAYGWADEHAVGTTLPADATSLIGAVVHNQMPMLVADWASETRFEQPAALRHAGVVSSLAVAIPTREQPFGSLSIDVTALRSFSDEEVQFMRAVAHVLALALDRSSAAGPLDEHTRVIETRLVAAAQERAVLEERQRLARELHDSVTQAMYSVTLHAQGIRGFLEAGNTAQVDEALCRLQDTAQEALDEMRMLIFELRPPVLEQIGLVAALEARLNTVEGRAHLRTKLVSEGIDKLPAPVEQALYRIAQEALNNTLRHARANQVTIRLHQTQRQIVLEIDDDGIGFQTAGDSSPSGLGLRGIAERVAQLNGSFTIQSALGAGSQLRVEIDL